MVRSDTAISCTVGHLYYLNTVTGLCTETTCKKLHQIGVCLSLGNLACLSFVSVAKAKSHFSLLSFCTYAWTEMLRGNMNVDLQFIISGDFVDRHVDF